MGLLFCPSNSHIILKLRGLRPFPYNTQSFDMVWKQSEELVWLDELDGTEKVFYSMSQAFSKIGKEHGSVYAVCKVTLREPTLKPPLDILLRNGWKALRFDYPALSVVANRSEKMYKAATPELVEQWVEETFSVDILHTAKEILSTLHLRKLPCLIFLPQSSEVIFQSSHWRIDALGTCMILNQLFEFVSRCSTDFLPLWHLEYQNLSPSLEDSFGSPKICSRTMEAMAETIRKRNFEASYPSAGLPFKGNATTEPALSMSKALILSSEATESLISACKAYKISVTAAIHAACAEAVFKLSQHKDHDYSTVVSANMRSYLPIQQHKSGTPYACGTYVTGITQMVQRTDDFATRSSHLTKAYREDWDPIEYLTALRLIYEVHGNAMLAVIKDEKRLPASNVTVSSLGLVENYLKSNHGSIVVENFRLGSMIMSRQPTLYIWTFRGQLTMSLDYNEAYYTIDTMTALLESIRDGLEKGLKVAVEPSQVAEE